MSADDRTCEPMEMIKAIRDDLRRILERVDQVDRKHANQEAIEALLDAWGAINLADVELGSIRASDFSASAASPR